MRVFLKDIEDYIEVQNRFISTVERIIEQGKTDSSIRKDVNIEATLITLINCFGLFTTKVSLNERISPLPESVSITDQQEILKHIFLQYLRG